VGFPFVTEASDFFVKAAVKAMEAKKKAPTEDLENR
jgi:hypothetical protein